MGEELPADDHPAAHIRPRLSEDFQLDKTVIDIDRPAPLYAFGQTRIRYRYNALGPEHRAGRESYRLPPLQHQWLRPQLPDAYLRPGKIGEDPYPRF